MGKPPSRPLTPNKSDNRPSVASKADPKEFGRIDINGKLLVINQRAIAFDNSWLQTSEVVGIRFGIYKHYTNGIRTSQSYGIWLTDQTSVMGIECAKGFLVNNSTIEKRYQDSLSALYQAVMVPIIQGFIDSLRAGSGFSVGDITFNKSGIHRTGRLGVIQRGFHRLLGGHQRVEERESEHRCLPWSRYGGHTFYSGYVRLHREKTVWAQFALRETWNAVCLGPMFDYLCQDGRIWQLVKR
jgi:hypothetical protein